MRKTNVVGLLGFLLVFLNFIAGCKNKPAVVEQRTINSISESVDALKKSILENGDTISYKDLRVYYLEHPVEDMLFWSLLMANKYDYTPAYSDVDYVLITSNRLPFDSVDTRTRLLALEYAIIASKRNNDSRRVIDSLEQQYLVMGSKNR